MTNIAFAGLTAAGKTTHAQRLATDLGYDYVSATDILFEILRVPRDTHPWFNQADAISAARQDGAVDAELESRLVDLARTRDRAVFDSWALAWICPVPVVRIGIESDLPSRTRKCLVSLGGEPRPLGECEAVLRSKDDYNRAMFLHLPGSCGGRVLPVVHVAARQLPDPAVHDEPVPTHHQNPLARVVQDHRHRAAPHPEDVLREPHMVRKLDIGQAHADVRGVVHQPLAVDHPLVRVSHVRGDVAGEVAEAECGSAEVLEAAVDRFGGSVAGAGPVEVGQHVDCTLGRVRPGQPPGHGVACGALAAAAGR
jgi:cytidylate kinase